jgi:hypothetical protein
MFLAETYTPHRPCWGCPKDARWSGLPCQRTGLPAPPTHVRLKPNPPRQSGLKRPAHIIPAAAHVPLGIGASRPSRGREHKRRRLSWLPRRYRRRRRLHYWRRHERVEPRRLPRQISRRALVSTRDLRPPSAAPGVAPSAARRLHLRAFP